MIRCYCGKLVFDGHFLKVRIAEFGDGAMNLKCPQCKRWLPGLNVRYLTGEMTERIDFRRMPIERRCEVDVKAPTPELKVGTPTEEVVT